MTLMTVLKSLFTRLFDNRVERSVASGFRRRRAALFKKLVLGPLRHPTIVDIGGTSMFWRSALSDSERAGVEIVCVNLEVEEDPRPDVEVVRGDACNLAEIPDGHFDVAFSNSVIEHVGDWNRQCAMAAEVRRVARSYWVQTPNRYFPLEPHFLFPAFQFLPRWAKRMVARHWPFGWMKAGAPETMSECDRIRLLSASEMRRLFPDAELIRERVGFMTKSLVCFRRAQTEHFHACSILPVNSVGSPL